MTPPCGAMDPGPTAGAAPRAKAALMPGQEFCMCSSLEVPSIAPPGVSEGNFCEMKDALVTQPCKYLQGTCIIVNAGTE